MSEGRGPTLQSSRSLDALSDLRLQRLEAELEGARQQAEGACQREKELRAELQRLQQEVAQLQESQRQVGLMLRPGVRTCGTIRTIISIVGLRTRIALSYLTAICVTKA